MKKCAVGRLCGNPLPDGGIQDECLGFAGALGETLVECCATGIYRLTLGVHSRIVCFTHF